jgi:pimeloyl-ACP methyl ester carboxylesterase
VKWLFLPAAALLLWGLVSAWYYFRQEAVIFQPSVLPRDHAFEFRYPFEPHRIPVAPNVELSALWFPARSVVPGTEQSPRGVVLYLHGNASDLQGWGHHADLYVEAGYDFLVIDYRGYGQSDGRIAGEAELHGDIERVMDWLEARRPGAPVIVVGYSLGAALAARVACPARAERLVLLAPFFSLRDLARRTVPFVPIRILRYPFRTDLVLADCDVPVTIFHGVHDATIPFDQSRRLAALLGDRARLVPLESAGHQDVPEDPVFRREMRELLSEPGASRASSAASARPRAEEGP